MPVIATIAIVAAASMAGLPPLLGFVAKEAVFTAFLEAAAAGEPWAWIALVGAFVGSVLTVAYTVRFVWGAFFTKAGVEPTPLHAERPRHRRRARHPLGREPRRRVRDRVGSSRCSPPYADELAGPRGATTSRSGTASSPPCGSRSRCSPSARCSCGAASAWRACRPPSPPMVDSARGYLGIVSVVDRLAAAVTTAIQHRGLPGYLATIVAVFVGGLGAASVMNTTWPDGIRLWDYPAQPFLAFVMAIAAVAAATVRQRMTAVLLVSVTGYGLVLLFGMSGAPDLALTQALVETIVLVVFVLVLRRLPKQIAQRNPPVHKVARGHHRRRWPAS